MPIGTNQTLTGTNQEANNPAGAGAIIQKVLGTSENNRGESTFCQLYVIIPDSSDADPEEIKELANIADWFQRTDIV